MSVANANLAVQVNHLSWKYGPNEPNVLHDVSFELFPGSRCLLIGSNGASKSTLLRILGGKHMIDRTAAFIYGKEAFHDTSLVNDVATVAERWQMVRDVSVEELTRGLNPEQDARKEKLMDVLDIDPAWRCYALSDGMRRRVQILVTLVRASKVMLLDEVTTDLDVVGRQNLLRYLKEETERSNSTIIYATHIFDGLDSWPTHICHLIDGRVNRFGPVSDFPELATNIGIRSPLFVMVESWLRAEWEEKRKIRNGRPRAQLIGLQDFQMNTDRSRSENIPFVKSTQ